MKTKTGLPIVALMAITVSFGTFAGSSKAEELQSFEQTTPGSLPQGWEVEATKQVGLLATWEVVREEGTPDGEQALVLTNPNHAKRGTYNLCWTDALAFLDGELEVQLKGNSGKIDQGGGLIWRVQDKDNYYICRANPLEDNLRLYYVKEGKRHQIASADVRIPTAQWHELEIEHQGTHIECSLNDEKLLEVDDDTFLEAGGVGLWTKADAATSFDALEVELGAESDEEE